MKKPSMDEQINKGTVPRWAIGFALTIMSISFGLRQADIDVSTPLNHYFMTLAKQSNCTDLDSRVSRIESDHQRK